VKSETGINILLRPSVKPLLRPILPLSRIRLLLDALLAELHHADAELSVLLTGDREIRRLNAEYRGKDKATDVLSFALQEGSAPELSGKALGDLVISLQTTLAQAAEFQVSPAEEFLRLLIHGLLHLLGYDHENVPSAEASRMRRKERALMRKLQPLLQQKRSRRQSVR
jgi:probable rRNA maturation factor